MSSRHFGKHDSGRSHLRVMISNLKSWRESRETLRCERPASTRGGRRRGSISPLVVIATVSRPGSALRFAGRRDMVKTQKGQHRKTRMAVSVVRTNEVYNTSTNKRLASCQPDLLHPLSLLFAKHLVNQTCRGSDMTHTVQWNQRSDGGGEVCVCVCRPTTKTDAS